MGVVECLVGDWRGWEGISLGIRGVQGGEQWSGKEVRGELTGSTYREWVICLGDGLFVWAWWVKVDQIMFLGGGFGLAGFGFGLFKLRVYLVKY